jgi:uncharacterized protein YigE (DUF2233 family)
MMVINGMINPVFKPGSSNVNIRNGVGVTKEGTVIFAVSRGLVSFYEMAEYFLQAGCVNALFLDGGISGYYFMGREIINDGYFGPIIAIIM